ncbi:hypothetical protein [Allosphingosinicella vermicomposti]|uniref:hypothetical protein n=1 Tax=Allosphingosinicella vermicomposti TaxID=614671 RepID=UPI000D108A63|nr:hypothetical protein [Allosphingosinicella vermicomposti]
MLSKMKSALAATALIGLAVSAHAAPRLSPDQRLAKAVEGRVAGEPVSCIDHSRIRSSRIIDGTAIVYQIGNTMYVNRPVGAEALDDWDVLVTRLHGSKLCDRDIVRLVDPNSRMLSGAVSLGEFVPYKKVKKTG